jgi:murein L,D-transpeptidase YcbB/YkuD
MNNIFDKRKYLLGGTAIALVVVGVFAVKFAADVADGTPKVTQAPVTAPADTTRKATVPAVDGVAALIQKQIERQPEAERLTLARLYELSSKAPLWMNGDRADHLKALDKTATLIEAHGIDARPLQALLTEAKTKIASPGDAARIDVALTHEVMRLASALRLGALPTQQLGPSWVMARDQIDVIPELAVAIKKNDIAGHLAALAPSTAQYKGLVKGLRRYREIVSQGGWPGLSGTNEIKLETADPRLATVHERLRIEGYFPAKGDITPAQTLEAVKLFQTRNGLEPDGRLGKGTLAALNVSAQERVGQIAANLERHRHTPRDLGKTYIAVNAASTTLEFVRDGEPALQLKVVAGDKRHATPILSAMITGVTLNPRWNIPTSIAGKEILPKLQKNPNYLAENNMVIVDYSDADPHGQFIDWSQYSVKNMNMRFRQRPGDDNALGYIKMLMTNPQNIYLHDTPSRQAFDKNERHLSHGCIRVDQPATLARHVLMGTPMDRSEGEWDEASLQEEINLGVTRTIPLKTPLPVHISYWTAVPNGDDVTFYKDIYQRDASLADALGINADTKIVMQD